MDDLAGLDWTSTQSKSSNTNTATSNANYFPTLKPTPPVSGRSTPSAIPPNVSSKLHGNPGASSKPGTPDNDSFAQLLPFHSGPKRANLSLQEQQKLLQEQKLGRGVSNGSFDSQQLLSPNPREVPAARSGSRSARTPSNQEIGSARNTQSLSSTVNKPFAAVSQPANGTEEQEDDLLAAFNADAPVDASTHFAPPSAISNTAAKNDGSNVLDDDPFDLAFAPKSAPAKPKASAEEEDDVLGLLGKPVSEVSQIKAAAGSPAPNNKAGEDDAALAELVDMGFPIEKSREALAHTGPADVQAAVSWLLKQAHSEARSRSRTPGGEAPPRRNRGDPRPPPAEPEGPSGNAAMPAWMRQQSRSASGSRTRDASADAGADKDPAKYAADLGNSLFKTANSLWKSGAKKINKAVADLNTETDSSQPKWMQQPRDSRQTTAPSLQSPESDSGPATSSILSPETPPSVTDEALLLESRPARKVTRPSKATHQAESRADSIGSSRPNSATNPISTQHRAMASSRPSSGQARLTRQAVEEEAQAYISPARRKRPAHKPQSEDAKPESSPSRPHEAVSRAQPREAPREMTTSNAPRPQSRSVPKPQPQPQRVAPQRKIPNVSSITLQSSTTQRLAGTAAFKLGNYADATTSYSRSLQDLPQGHPLTIVLLTNRALTHLKNGDPKSCIADADAAIAVVGPSKGANEKIDLGGQEGSKDMAPFWGKAMMRRAEALEQLERWNDALQVWKECVENGVGGNTSIQGRTRCERAAGGNTAPKPSAARATTGPSKPTPKPIPKRTALNDLTGDSTSSVLSGEAVNRLRAANAKAAQVDDEKFALSDAVEARLTNWRNGKEGNLRALLGSLDTILWENSGWKKVGMSELIMPAKVKVAYMKGIAKVHPDKVGLPHGIATHPAVILTASIAADDGFHRAGHDQWSGFQHLERSLGSVQVGKWAVRLGRRGRQASLER